MCSQNCLNLICSVPSAQSLLALLWDNPAHIQMSTGINGLILIFSSTEELPDFKFIAAEQKPLYQNAQKEDSPKKLHSKAAERFPGQREKVAGGCHCVTQCRGLCAVTASGNSTWDNSHKGPGLCSQRKIKPLFAEIL